MMSGTTVFFRKQILFWIIIIGLSCYLLGTLIIWFQVIDLGRGEEGDERERNVGVGGILAHVMRMDTYSSLISLTSLTSSSSSSSSSASSPSSSSKHRRLDRRKELDALERSQQTQLLSHFLSEIPLLNRSFYNCNRDPRTPLEVLALKSTKVKGSSLLPSLLSPLLSLLSSSSLLP